MSSPKTPREQTIDTAVERVTSAINCADRAGKLPEKFAAKLLMRLKQRNARTIELLRREVRDEGWDLHVFDEGSAADVWAEAYLLCIQAATAIKP